MAMLRFILVCALVLPAVVLKAQEQKLPIGKEGQFTFETDKPYKLLELDKDTSEPIVTKKRKPKRNTYYGIKVRRSYTRKGLADKTIFELFNVLKKPDKPTAFVRDIYW